MRSLLACILVTSFATFGLHASDEAPKPSPLAITIARDVPGVLYPKDSTTGIEFQRSGILYPQDAVFPALTDPKAADELLSKSPEELSRHPEQVLLLSNALERQGRFTEFQKYFSLPALPVKPENLASVEAQIAQRAAKVSSVRLLYLIESPDHSGQWLFYESMMGEKAWVNADYFAKTEAGYRLAEGNLNKDKDVNSLFNALVHDQMKGAHSVEIKPQ